LRFEVANVVESDDCFPSDEHRESRNQLLVLRIIEAGPRWFKSFLDP
jgi:hypothetical protein